MGQTGVVLQLGGIEAGAGGCPAFLLLGIGGRRGVTKVVSILIREVNEL